MNDYTSSANNTVMTSPTASTSTNEMPNVAQTVRLSELQGQAVKLADSMKSLSHGITEAYYDFQSNHENVRYLQRNLRSFARAGQELGTEVEDCHVDALAGLLNQAASEVSKLHSRTQEVMECIKLLEELDVLSFRLRYRTKRCGLTRKKSA